MPENVVCDLVDDAWMVLFLNPNSTRTRGACVAKTCLVTFVANVVEVEAHGDRLWPSAP
jgi:hypothetical protein